MILYNVIIYVCFCVPCFLTNVFHSIPQNINKLECHGDELTFPGCIAASQNGRPGFYGHCVIITPYYAHLFTLSPSLVLLFRSWCFWILLLKRCCLYLSLVSGLVLHHLSDVVSKMQIFLKEWCHNIFRKKFIILQEKRCSTSRRKL